VPLSNTRKHTQTCRRQSVQFFVLLTVFVSFLCHHRWSSPQVVCSLLNFLAFTVNFGIIQLFQRWLNPFKICCSRRETSEVFTTQRYNTALYGCINQSASSNKGEAISGQFCICTAAVYSHSRYVEPSTLSTWNNKTWAVLIFENASNHR